MSIPPGNLQKKPLSIEIAVTAKQNSLPHCNIHMVYQIVICIWLAIHIPHVYDYMTKLCRQQAKVIQNHENENVHNIGQGTPQHRKYKRLKLGGGHIYGQTSA
jgi:hypothetical protein